jgi:signal transduction histidine kinase
MDTDTKFQKNVAKRIVQPVLRYLDDVYGPEITETILNEIQLDRLYFDDQNGFMPLEITDQLFQIASIHTGDKDFAYTMGRNIVNYTPSLQSMVLLAFASPALVFKNMGKVEQKIVSTTCVQTTRIGPNKFLMKISFKDNYKEPHSACRNRQGTYEAIPTYFGLPYAHVDHPRCAFRGDKNCEYIVTVPESQSHVFFKAALGSLLLSCVFFGLQLLLKSKTLAIFSMISLPAALLFYLNFIRQSFQQKMKWLKNGNELLKKSSEELDQENVRTKYLQNLAISLNKELSVDEICKEVGRTLIENFYYDSSQIWLTHEDRFFCAGAYGYNPDVLEYLKKTQYYISEGMNHPQGFIVKVLKDKKTLLINDIQSETSGFTSQSQILFANFKVSSGIIIPLSENGVAFGMLVGVNNEKKVTYTDKILFEALTHIVSNSLFKARLYEDMERKVAKRDEEIRKRQEQLLLTKEMAIQNEKLSALGQMAASIAHEINNPLNFLFNILPDIKKDYDTLKNIALQLRPSLNEKQKIETEKIFSEYQLDTHLEEIDNVYEFADNALDKAKRTANSLAVFARSADREKITDENLKLLTNQTIDLIPSKYLSGIKFNINIDPSITLKINRIEFQQAIMSLIRNGIESMEKGGLITILAVKNESSVEIRFEDQGCGIKEEQKSEIFKPFFTTKDTQFHTGLGLYIVWEITKKYGGRITFESLPQGGTVFILSLSNHLVDPVAIEVSFRNE